MMRIDANSWYYSPDHGQLCQVIETQAIWCETTCRVWLPGSDSVVRIPAANLKPLEDAATGTPHQITYVADALTDEPGLGKAIEAGLIMRELKLRARNRYEEVKSWFVEIRSKANLEMSHV